MSRHDDAVRLRHMLDAARKAVALTAGKARVDVDSDEVIQLALARLLEIIGEAAVTRPRMDVWRRRSARLMLVRSPRRTRWPTRLYEPERAELAPGDRVRITRNDAALDLANGDRFTVAAVSPRAITLDDGKRRVELPADRPLHLDHGYATTVHSSQGTMRRDVRGVSAVDRLRRVSHRGRGRQRCGESGCIPGPDAAGRTTGNAFRAISKYPTVFRHPSNTVVVFGSWCYFVRGFN